MDCVKISSLKLRTLALSPLFENSEPFLKNLRAVDSSQIQSQTSTNDQSNNHLPPFSGPSPIYCFLIFNYTPHPLHKPALFAPHATPLNSPHHST
ncbi:hypothetical protein RIF29_21444 [Crotalaria pallida]|uniref:Uncharacterized protein n=1 Tax=Crotalaria pallida TaxID=3830 RepID=A0AAN9IDE6_CROPI